MEEESLALLLLYEAPTEMEKPISGSILSKGIPDVALKGIQGIREEMERWIASLESLIRTPQ